MTDGHGICGTDSLLGKNTVADPEGEGTRFSETKTTDSSTRLQDVTTPKTVIYKCCCLPF